MKQADSFSKQNNIRVTECILWHVKRCNIRSFSFALDNFSFACDNFSFALDNFLFTCDNFSFALDNFHLHAVIFICIGKFSFA